MTEDDNEGVGFVYPIRFAALLITLVVAVIVGKAIRSETVSAASTETTWCGGCGPTVPEAAVVLLGLGAVVVMLSWYLRRRLQEVTG